MGALTSGTTAPDISLKDPEGKTATLAAALEKGPALVAFFKVSCPTCQFTFPFLERMYENCAGGNITFLGVSQDGAADTREFVAEFGTKFPVVMDERGYPVSNEYGLTNVPSLFWIRPDGRIAISSVGFSKADLEKISAEAARATGQEVKPLFRPGEVVPDYKPG